MIELISVVVPWWSIFFILGILALPVASKIFSVFFDKGYIFSKILGLITVSYSAYVLGTLHILPFSTLSLLIITALLGSASIVYAVRNNTLNTFRNKWKVFLFEELLFFVGILFWAFIKSFQPDIHGLEKFMDYGFLNSLLRTNYFPAKDMWMTPLSINYYYFGHIMTAVVTKLSFLPSTITFNLMLATLFSFTFTQGFSLGGNLIYLLKINLGGRKEGLPRHAQQLGPTGPSSASMIGREFLTGPVIAGLITAYILTFGGNLHTIYTFFIPYQNENPVPPTQLTFSPATFPNQYWYPNATRFIYHTIHEFPIYSFVVSDLHGHVLDIPSVLLMIALLLIIATTQFKKLRNILFASAGLGSLAGIMYMTNAWDGLIYLGVSIVLIIFKDLNVKTNISTSSKYQVESIKQKNLLHTTYYILLIIAAFAIIGLPFSFFFKPFASQIGLNCAPDFLLRIGNIGPLVFEHGYCQYSPLWQLSILYGFFFFWFISYLAFLLWHKKVYKKIHTVDLFVAGLGITGFLLILIPEFFYLKDIYTTYFRANTMFKLVYQSFILLSLVSGYSLVRIFSNFKTVHKNIFQRVLSICYTLFAICLLTLVSIYPYFAVMSYFNNLKDYKGLDGTLYLKNISNDDYNAIQWINHTIHNQPVMLEAQGDSYTDYERISANTGIPTVFGWMVHEWLWRGTYDIVPGRIEDVKNLYNSQTIEQTRKLLQKYHVQYVYVGDLERSKYPEINENKFKLLGKIIYSSGSVKIYRIN